ncbi:DUF4238 domain-containing protein [Variovorax saccharolyticus]|uniref:DUF4238 domain-containing protein n=1 Tax=Variovorax saccharolyticus TaxID=3053516 RepID=UPI0025753820|nr:DUF4238 domain-containing protein [Variovorax sp. J22R187]MDM0022107.1 DUF4238 domain-containing protein [Variovorax sp. J22R187]
MDDQNDIDPGLLPFDAFERATEPAPVLKGPKRQHYLPRFYLEGFADDDGLVALFDQKENEVRLQQPVNTAVIGHFYTMEDEQGRQRFEIEEMLSKVEGAAKPVIDKLTARESITDQERADLAAFVALAAMRTPARVDNIQKMMGDAMRQVNKVMFSNTRQVKTQLQRHPEYQNLGDDEMNKQAKDLVAFVQGGEYEIETNEKWALQTSIQTAMEMMPMFAARDWIVEHCANPKKSFVTADAPVLLQGTGPQDSGFLRGVGFGSANALIAFPLNASAVLLLLGNGGSLQYVNVDQERVRTVNLAIASRCFRFVVGRHARLVDSLAKDLNLAKRDAGRND